MIFTDLVTEELQQLSHAANEKQTDNAGLDIPMYDATVDYQYLYHKLFQENESKLQQYDKLLELRDRDLKAYMALKKG